MYLKWLYRTVCIHLAEQFAKKYHIKLGNNTKWPWIFIRTQVEGNKWKLLTLISTVAFIRNTYERLTYT